ncbi:MAG: DUF4372 domain-containing protein [Bacteroidetes bacterium]|nr:DUF4372 domain-containing protein [Bacteroidota bacterium]
MSNITIFAQMVSILPRNLFQKEVAKPKPEFASKGLDAWTHLTAIRILPIAKGFTPHSEKAPPSVHREIVERGDIDLVDFRITPGALEFIKILELRNTHVRLGEKTTVSNPPSV